MNKQTLIDGKSKPAKTPKIASGQGGARPGAGRKEGVEVSSKAYQLYNTARAKKTVHEAKLAEYEEREKAGQLIEVDLVRNEWQQILANVRAKLLSLPTKLAAQALGANTLAEMEALLADAVYEALQELAADA
ncbi:MAG: hypothetical protein FIA96_11205 [Betaproteobacteria bacterium]|nr:hypothetical protein [Betaproteobacteria bacterium]